MSMTLGCCDTNCARQGAAMPISDVRIAQIRLILDSLPGAAAYPSADHWGDVDDVAYLYRENAILVREQDVEHVTKGLGEIFDLTDYGNVPVGKAPEIVRARIASRIVRLTLPRTPMMVPELLDR